MGHADHTAHRRAQLGAHHREELGLLLLGPLHFHSRLAQRQLRLLPGAGFQQDDREDPSAARLAAAHADLDRDLIAVSAPSLDLA